MKTPRPSSVASRTFTTRVASLLLFLLVAQMHAAELPTGAVKAFHPAPDEFALLGKAVTELFKGGGAAQFATNLTATAQDWLSICSTNLPAPDKERLNGFQMASDFERQKIESSAKVVLEKAAALHLDFGKGEWHARPILPKQFGSTHRDGLQAKNETLPWTERVEIVLETGAAGGSSTNGDSKLSVRGLIKFPGGWRCYDGIHWESFPSNVGDEATRRELALLSKVAAYQGFTGQDDPALIQLGDTLVRFLRQRDVDIYLKDAALTADLIWRQIEKSGRPGPSRKEFDEEFNLRLKEQVDRARGLVQQMTEAGIDLKNAHIRIASAAVERTQSQGAPGSLDGLMGQQFKLKLLVKSEGNSKSGTALSGEYILAADQLMRFANDWKIMGTVHWYKLPDGVLSPEVVAKVEFENYVAQFGTLPPQTAAPDIDFITIDSEKRLQLSSLKGKVVVLDFWATWCGPCQEPMADLQKLRLTHPDWKDRVAIMALSIDDTIGVVRKHLEKRGWTNTFNVWSDEGGWRSKPATAFRVSGVPTTYIIDAEGKIVQAGHPSGMQIGESVDRVLQR